MRITVQYFDGCPHWHEADALVGRYADEHPGVEVEYVVVDTVEAAEEHQFRGSPTLLVDGIDPFASGDEPVGLSCRVYATPDGPAGVPTYEQLAAAAADARM